MVIVVSLEKKEEVDDNNNDDNFFFMKTMDDVWSFLCLTENPKFLVSGTHFRVIFFFENCPNFLFFPVSISTASSSSARLYW